MKRTVSVKFQKEFSNTYESKEYHFFALDDVAPGDLVVVQTVNGTRLAQVVRHLHSSEKNFANKYIIQRVDMDAYANKIKEEEEIANLKATIEMQLEEHTRLEYYRDLAENSKDDVLKSAAKELLSKLEK